MIPLFIIGGIEPLVKIEIVSGHDKDYKATLLQTVHLTLMDVLKIPDDDRYQRLYELDEANYERGTGGKTFTLIELALFPGRNKEMKKSVIKQLTQRLSEALTIPPSDVFIVIHEPPLDNWGFCGSQASELDLQYKQE